MPRQENSIFVLTGQEDEQCPYNYGNTGMPEFNQPDEQEYHAIKVYFRNEEDLQEFAAKIDQNLTRRTKWTWHPKLNSRTNTLLRYVDDSE